MPPPKILYVSFDQVPAPKGASTHIVEFVTALGKKYGGTPIQDESKINAPTGNVVLVTPAAEDQPVSQRASGVQHLQLGCSEDNPLGRAKIFRKKLAYLLSQQPFNLIHFRSIFAGVVVCDSKLNRGAKLIYEANGFPSVEMKYHYPQLMDQPELTNKLIRQETDCLNAVDHIITVSDVTRQFIESRLPAPKPISVIRNGYDPAEFRGRLPPAADDGPIRIAYVGTASHWQGIETLLEAVELANKERPCKLTIMGPASRRRQAEIETVITRLKIGHCIHQQVAYSKDQVCGLLHQSHMTVVPLMPVDRNTQQGCCPIKMIEAMASGCPVIASNLPVIQELARPEIDYLPAKPGDARNFKNLILQLAGDSELRIRLSKNARQQAKENLTWHHATEQLIGVYKSVLT